MCLGKNKGDGNEIWRWPMRNMHAQAGSAANRAHSIGIRSLGGAAARGARSAWFPAGSEGSPTRLLSRLRSFLQMTNWQRDPAREIRLKQLDSETEPLKRHDASAMQDWLA